MCTVNYSQKAQKASSTFNYYSYWKLPRYSEGEINHQEAI